MGGLIWLFEFLRLGGLKLAPFFAGILVALLQCVRDDEEAAIRAQANKTKEELYALIGELSVCETESESEDGDGDGHGGEHNELAYEVLDILRGACKSDFVRTKLAALDLI